MWRLQTSGHGASSRLVLAALLLLSSSHGSAPAGAALPAFPGAVGFGAPASGGRGGALYKVTTLADAGPGSLRDAVSARNRTVVFAVGGYIVLESVLSIASDITIAGQTAPGGGIGVMGREISLSGSSNVIVRGLRIRQGSLDPDRGKSALNIGTSHSVIVDHCSVAFGSWDSIDAVGATNFTVAYSIIADPIGQQFGAHVEVGPAAFYRNLWVNAHNRQPLAKADTVYVNNFVYDFELGFTAGNTAGHFRYDVVDNLFVCGPKTGGIGGDAFFQVTSNEQAFALGNFLACGRDGTLSGTPLVGVGGAVPLAAPWSPATAAMPIFNAVDTFANLLVSAGAFPRDEVDLLVLSDVASLGTRGALYTTQVATGLGNQGYGVIAAGVPFADDMIEGVADYWAIANGLRGPGSAPFGASGYTVLEAFINSLVLPAPWSAADLPGGPPQIAGVALYNALKSSSPWLLVGGGGAGHFASTVAPPTTFLHTLTLLTLSDSSNAGLLFLNSNTSSSAALSWANNGSVAFEWRSEGGPVQRSSLTGFRLPLPLRLSMGDDRSSCEGFASANGGATWLSVGKAPSIALGLAFDTGMFARSLVATAYAVAAFAV